MQASSGEQTAARSSTVDPNTSVLQQVGREKREWFVDGRGLQLLESSKNPLGTYEQ